MILVTGAGGKTGRAIIRRLTESGQKVRAWVRRPDAAVEGATEHFVGDMTVEADWPRALERVDRLYLISPNMHPLETEIGRMAVAAVRRDGVKRLVYHSVLHPQTEAMPHHWAKLRVEETIVAAGVPYVILQPAAYMQNLRAQLQAITEEGLLRLPYPTESEISLVDLNDVAEIAARALADDGLLGGTFELCGTAPLNQHLVAAVFADTVDKPVEAKELSLEEWEAGAAGLTPYARETLKKMFRYYARHGLVGNPLVLTALLGRQPTQLPEIVKGWFG